MSRGWFITGTDTGVGKTCVSVALLRALKSSGRTVSAMKPVASGCVSTESGLRNEDAERLLAECSLPHAYELINPYAFEPPIAPHLAADAVDVCIDIARISTAFDRLAATAEAIVVEGVGGWLVPINAGQSMQDVAVTLQLPVVLVVGIRLGCLNHALLTATAIEGAGLTLAGWVANRIDPECQQADANVQALRERLSMPLLADFPFAARADWPQQRYTDFDLAPLLASRAFS